MVPTKTINHSFHCQRVGTTVCFKVKEVPLPGPGVPLAIAHSPKCSGWPRCGAFAGNFPQSLEEIQVVHTTGCPFFDSRNTGSV